VNAFLRARRAEEAMRKSNEELRLFTYRVGHDLNEPLRTITAHSQLLKRRLGADNEPEIAATLDFIVEGAAKMRYFIEGLLQYSQATGCSDQPGLVDCETLLQRVIGNLDSSIHDNGARITHDPLPSVSANGQLEYVFQNLISNAIKYGKPGIAPRIHVGVRDEGGGWLFSVEDNGIGIEPQYRERIFEMFQRLHGQEIAGNGIGLALVRKIVEGLGGKIWVESTEGAGSTFYLRLPARPAATNGQAA
jgi:light-regulated signal transduction histidine kinase (bacteriophytochrome)